jgi:hypothetical protein
MGAKFNNAADQLCRARYDKDSAKAKKAVEDMVKFSEAWNEADRARLAAVKENHHIDEALQKMIDFSDTRAKADNTRSSCRKIGKKLTEANAAVDAFDNKSAEKTEARVNRVKNAFGWS